MKFQPRRDLWLSIVMWSCVAVLCVSGLTPLFFEGAGIVGGTIIFMLCFTFAGVSAWLWVNTYYEIREEDLYLRSGPIKKTIPLTSIYAVIPTKSVLSSMATSSRRLEIKYGKYDFVHISPLNEEAFIKELMIRCPNLNKKMNE